MYMQSAPTSPSPPHGVIFATNSNYFPKQSSTINLPNVNVIKYFNYGLVVYTTLCSEMSMTCLTLLQVSQLKGTEFLESEANET